MKRLFRSISLLVLTLGLLVGTSGSARSLAPEAVTLTVSNPYCTQVSAGRFNLRNQRAVYQRHQ